MADLDARDAWVSRVLGVEVAPASPVKLSVAKLAKSRLAWRGQRMLAISELGRLQGLITAKFGAATDQAKAVDGARRRLDQLMNKLGPDLDDALDAVLNAKGPVEMRKQVGEARRQLQSFQSLIDQDEVMAELDGNEVMPEMKIVAPLQQRLTDIAAVLP